VIASAAIFRRDRVAPASVLGRELQAQVAGLCQPAEHVVGEPAGLLPLLGVGSQPGLDKGADLGPQPLVLGRERRYRPAV